MKPMTYIDGLPAKTKTAIIVFLFLILPFLVTASKPMWWPPSVVAPINTRIDNLQVQVEANTRHLQQVDNSFSKIERYLCYQNRDNALLSGMDCPNSH